MNFNSRKEGKTEKSQTSAGKISIGLQLGRASLEIRNLSPGCLRFFRLALLPVLDPLYLIWQWSFTFKQKNKTICVNDHCTQTNTDNVNKTWALLQTTRGKDEPTIVFYAKSQHGNQNVCLDISIFFILSKISWFTKLISNFWLAFRYSLIFFQIALNLIE
jgi:hypothetical protein